MEKRPGICSSYNKLTGEIIKDVLLNVDNTIGIAVNNKQNVNAFNGNAKTSDMFFGVMPRCMFLLGSNYSVGFPKNIWVGKRADDQYLTWATYFETIRKPGEDKGEGRWRGFANEFYLSDSDVNEINAIKDYENQISSLQKKVSEDKDGEYDKEGIIKLPRYEIINSGYSYEEDKVISCPTVNLIEHIIVKVNQRELIEAGILPSMLGWKEKSKLSSKEIAEADVGYAITTKEVSKVGKFINKILDKLLEKVVKKSKDKIIEKMREDD